MILYRFDVSNPSNVIYISKFKIISFLARSFWKWFYYSFNALNNFFLDNHKYAHTNFSKKTSHNIMLNYKVSFSIWHHDIFSSGNWVALFNITSIKEQDAEEDRIIIQKKKHCIYYECILSSYFFIFIKALFLFVESEYVQQCLTHSWFLAQKISPLFS